MVLIYQHIWKFISATGEPTCVTQQVNLYTALITIKEVYVYWGLKKIFFYIHSCSQ